ncbi:glycine zipper 2TM domain-containing protein [Sphingomonas sp. RS2018]
MRTLALAGVAAATLLAGCSSYGDYGPDPRYSGYSRYDYDRPDPSVNGYYADQYYVDNRRYRERQLSNNDRVYVGRDGRYYCRRNDGTTGLIVGGLAGGALGAAIAPGNSGLLGALLGGAAGAALGQSAERSNARNNVRCR